MHAHLETDGHVIFSGGLTRNLTYFYQSSPYANRENIDVSFTEFPIGSIHGQHPAFFGFWQFTHDKSPYIRKRHVKFLEGSLGLQYDFQIVLKLQQLCETPYGSSIMGEH